MSLTSVVSAVMMGKMGHGDAGPQQSHGMPHLGGPCEHSKAMQTADSSGVISNSTHLAQTHDPQNDVLVTCSMCALCTSIVPDMDINSTFVGGPIIGDTFEVARFYSKALGRLDRPPRP